METNKEGVGEKILGKLVFVVFILAAAILGYYFVRFRGKDLLDSTEKLGQFGDYIGGLINPIVGLVTVVLIFFTLRIQQRELQASLREMQHANSAAARMSFEQSLFAWLENYHAQIREIELSNGMRGRMALNSLYTENLSPASTAKGVPRKMNSNFTDYDANQFYLSRPAPFKKPLFEDGMSYAIVSYAKIYRENREYIGAAFRTLYRLFKWIDESQQLTAKDKWHYCALIRSQLSWSETLFIYFNGFIPEGEKMAYYVNKYALLDNLETSDELINWARYEVSSDPDGQKYKIRGYLGTWPYTERAFESDTAKRGLRIQ